MGDFEIGVLNIKIMSEIRRFFAQPSERDGDKIFLQSQYNHIAKVLRMKFGDEIFVCFDDGVDHLCKIQTIDSQTVTLKILSSNICQNENQFSTTLFVGALKSDKNELVVQKAVELGANKIVFFDSKFAISKFDSKKIERLNKISLEASKQCGRAVVVPVEYTTINKIPKSFCEFDSVIFCNEKENSLSLKDALKDKVPKNIAVITGSEGGFSDDEIEFLKKANATSVTLGKRILRAETAPICVISALNFLIPK